MNDNLTARCRKHEKKLPSDIVQDVLKKEGNKLAEERFNALRARVERNAKVIVRHFKVDRTKTPEQLLAALGRKESHVDREVLATMPTDGPEEGDLFFFPLKCNTPVTKIERVFEERGLIPDYAAQMQVNADDPAFADERPNGMQWGNYNYNCVSFGRWDDDRKVGVGRYCSYWDSCTLFAGRLK